MYSMGRSVTNDRETHYEWSADNLTEVDNGILTRADSLPELAHRLGLDAEALVASIERWNAQCDRGNDGDYGRRPETMFALRTPPYYAGKLWPVLINTHGGPVHNANQQLLDPYGEPIPRLYAAGELGGVFGHIYLAGGNLAECFVGGRAAGQHAANLTPWAAD
jgi:predicted oxidoreductase